MALNKIDALAPDEIKQQLARLKRAMRAHGPPRRRDKPASPLAISAATGAGVDDALHALSTAIGEPAQIAERDESVAAWQP